MDRLDLSIRFDTTGDAGEFSGHAVVWGERNRHGEIVQRGAFRRSLDAHKAAGTKPVMLWSHDPSEIIGVWNEIREDDTGLFVSGKLITGINSGREAYERLKAGAVNGLSIGFRVLPGGESRSAGVKLLTGIDLQEISIVGMPSAGKARITTIRSSGRPAESAAAFIEACRKAKCALAAKREMTMQHFTPLQTRAAPDDDPLAAATQAVDEMRTSVTEFQTRTDERLAGLDEIRTQLTDLETRMNRPGGTGNTPPGELPIERRAFTNFLRLGDNRMAADEVRALIVGDDTKGGYLAPAEFQTEVIRGILEISPIRQAVRVGSTSAGSVILPKLTGRPTASWVGEDEERDETTMSYGQLEIPIHEIACFIDVSLRLLEDAAINVESEISTELSQEFAIKENAAFSNGDGAKKPLGIQRMAGVGEVVNGHATVLNADKLIALLYSLPTAYRNTGSWLMNGTTLGIVRTMKDGQGNYIWQPGLQNGQPSTLLGRPVIEDPTMPDIANGTFPIWYGDFTKAYRIFDRVGMSILRDPYTQATKGMVRFHARRRVGGGPTLAEALRKLKMAA